MRRKKLLFMAEAVTLAHVARPLALAAALGGQNYDIHLACADGFDFCWRDSDPPRIRIDSISSARFLNALAAGKPVYDEATLSTYVEDDLRLLRMLKPDLVLGDFRLSLSVSARLARVPYVSLINAYWSPHVRQHFMVPALALSKMLPIGIADALFRIARPLAFADALFRIARPLAFAAHTVPLNRVRRKYGLAPLGFDLRRVYTDADHTLYADIPQLFPAHDLPANHSYLGPLIWSPPVAPPPWWDAPDTGRPLVYVTLGSSGQGRLLPLVLQALAPLPVTVLAATAGQIELDAAPANARVAPYLPGEAAARRASLVICNGGSPTSQQALAAGVPLIGIAGNLDQFLNMHGVAAKGAGVLLRADRFDEGELRSAVADLLDNAEAAAAARKIAQAMAAYSPGERFAALLTALLVKRQKR
jgi:UDP:flavonoid glycosyltransferase YjiC (YdhE family)